jgi:hypothetical protein
MLAVTSVTSDDYRYLFAFIMSQAAEEVYAKAMANHEANAFLHMLAAQYVRMYRKNKHVEMLHISVAEVRGLCSNAYLGFRIVIANE